MNKQWHIWTVFSMSLCVVLTAMVWLTLKINESDHLINEDRKFTEIARREAELQELVNSALFRIDARFTPLIAKEAARPYYLYESFYNPSSAAAPLSKRDPATGGLQLPSPLIVGTPKYVQLHFQIAPDDSISSPQRPMGVQCQQAIACCNISESEYKACDAKLAAVGLFCSFETIQSCCPSSTIDNPSVLAGDSQTIYIEPTPFTNNPLPNQSTSAMLSNGNNQNPGPGNSVPPSPPALNVLEKRQVANTIDSLAFENGKLDAQRMRNQYRGNASYNTRRDVAQKYAQNEWTTNNMASGISPNYGTQPQPPVSREIREGMMRPFWIDDHLLLARRVTGQENDLVQCCWLNWEEINRDLRESFKEALSEINASEFDDFEFVPVRDEQNPKFDHSLATLPVQLVLNSKKLLASFTLEPYSKVEIPQLSGLRMAVIVAWCSLFLAIVATAFLLSGVVRLSNRRAAFVSAVTHELRTPLTTFRMYAEMMAEKMVPPEKQQHYAETLTVQADRLSQLVENVLQFAKLERVSNQGRVTTVAIEQLMDTFVDRLQQRADQAAMKLELDCSACGSIEINTDSAKVEQIVFNLVDNACKYACHSPDNRIEINCESNKRKVLISVRDYGPGVANKFRKTLFQPFRKSDQDAANTAPGVGLGLALCERMAKSIGGRVYLDNSNRTDGAQFILELPRPQTTLA